MALLLATYLERVVAFVAERRFEPVQIAAILRRQVDAEFATLKISQEKLRYERGSTSSSLRAER